MRKLLVAMIASALLASMGAIAAENHPDCEDGQAGDFLSDRTATLRGATGTGACEGEHWDGQDPVKGDYVGTVDTTGGSVGVNYRGSYAGTQPDINNNNVVDVVHVRVSTTGTNTYTRADIWSVGVAGAYVGPGIAAAYIQDYSDSAITFAGLEDDYDMAYNAVHSVRYGSGEHRSDGNVLAGVVHFPHITKGENFGNSDCTQASYEAGDCDRDNTAATVEYLP